MNKIIVLLVFLCQIPSNNLTAGDWSLGANLGIARPGGRFKDLSEVYSSCLKDNAYSTNDKVKIENSTMGNAFYYDIILSNQVSEHFSFDIIVNHISNEIDGIKVETKKLDIPSSKLIDEIKSPEFTSTNICMVFNYIFYPYKVDMLKFGVGLNFSNIYFNSFTLKNSMPENYIIENLEQSLGVGINARASYELFFWEKYSVSVNYQILQILKNYNHNALSVAYNCFPLGDTNANPFYAIYSIGFGYEL